MIDIGSGTGKVLLHSSYYCKYNIGIEYDLQSYFISAGMIEKFRSERICVIQAKVGSDNDSDIREPFPALVVDNRLPPCCVYLCVVGWGPADLEVLRNIIDKTNQIRVVAYNCREESSHHFDLKNPRDGISWEKKHEFPCHLFGSGSQITFKIYVKVGDFDSNIIPVKRSRKLSHLIVAMDLIKAKVSSHFHRYEHSEYLEFGAFDSSCQDWIPRTQNFFKSCRQEHSCGRILPNFNNCCYVNSALSVLCNQPIIRSTIQSSGLKIPRRIDISKGNRNYISKSTLLLLMAYSKKPDPLKAGCIFIFLFLTVISFNL